MRDLVGFLAGRWAVQRTLAHGDERGSFEGAAEFTRDGDGLVWDERGRLRFQRYDGEARRRLLVVPGADGWEVRFDDGRLFHPLELGEEDFAAFHPCGEDAYSGTYRVVGEDELLVTWRVRGPRKDQEIVSRYRRT
jgi:hypothetical protein